MKRIFIGAMEYWSNEDYVAGLGEAGCVGFMIGVME